MFQKCDGMVILIEGNYNDLCVVNFCREREDIIKRAIIPEGTYNNDLILQEEASCFSFITQL